MEYRAILFDMDGVLYDSMPNHATAWQCAMERCGMSMTREEVYMNEGRTGEGTINIFTRRQWGRDATPDEIQSIYQIKSDIFNTLPTPLPMRGAKEVLDLVKEAGLLRVIVTGSGQASLLQRLDEAYPHHFTQDVMVTAFDVTHGKPHPDPYLMGLEKAGRKLGLDRALTPSEAIVVENAPLGIQAAKAAGIYTIAVNTGPLSDQVLTDAGADIVLRDMHGLKEWLQQKSQTTNNDIHQSLPLSMRQPATWRDRGEDMLV